MKFTYPSGATPLDGYTIKRGIGIGGFGEVYLAEMSTPSGFTKTVAVKLLRDDIQQQQATAQRMRDEARLLGMLRHRSIVQAEDLITLAGRTAVVFSRQQSGQQDKG